jgi:hypothetical protein
LISDPDESTFGPPRYFFKGVPPQPNCPPAGVPLTRLATQFRKAGVTLLPQEDPEALLRRLPTTLCNRNRIAATSCSKAPQGLLSPMEVGGLFVHLTWVRRVADRDSGALVGPFMHVGTHPTRHLAHVCYFFLRRDLTLL